MDYEKEEGDEGLPELPQTRTDFTKPLLHSSIPEMDEPEEEKNVFPSFPDSPTEKGFSQSAIKEAVRDDEESEEEEKKDKRIKTIEMEEWTPPKVPKVIEETKRIPKLPKLAEKIGVNDPATLELPSERKKDIFVKIEKFKIAKKSMESIIRSMDEVETLMKKIRETKMREEQEFSNWEKEIESVKSRVQNVRENIFEQVE